MNEILKITRKRSLNDYLRIIDHLSFKQGDGSVKLHSLRWDRLQLCVDSVVIHLLGVFGNEKV